MANINEQMVLEYFSENEGNITTDRIYERFANVKTDDISKVLGDLINKRFVDADDNDNWVLLEKGKIFIQDELEKAATEREFKKLELEKTKVDLELAKKVLKDYPNTKSKANWGLIIAVIVAFIEFVRFLGYIVDNK